MAKKRGGQSKHWAELARVWAWYYKVRRRSGLSDYKLNYEFAWRENYWPDRANDHRPHIFEWLRKSARKPAGRDPRWRNMKELVDAVERYPGLSGTQALYEAELWDLMQEEAPRPEQVIKQLDDLLSANSLVRLPANRILDPELPLPSDFDETSVYDRCLTLSLRSIDRYSGIAMVWMLYLLTEPAHNWKFRAILESRADELLDNFFADYLEKKHLAYYTNATQALLATRMDLSMRRTHGYGYIETSGKWPIIPAHLAGKVTENHLLSATEIVVLSGNHMDSNNKNES